MEDPKANLGYHFLIFQLVYVNDNSEENESVLFTLLGNRSL